MHISLACRVLLGCCYRAATLRAIAHSLMLSCAGSAVATAAFALMSRAGTATPQLLLGCTPSRLLLQLLQWSACELTAQCATCSPGVSQLIDTMIASKNPAAVA
jgi:hypothetical protein